MFDICFNHPASMFYINYRRQLAATLTVNLITLSHGIGLGWAAPMLLKFQSPNSPLLFGVSVQEASWIGALVSLGGLNGNLIFGSLLDLIGRKKCIYLLAVPHICFWTLIFFANDVRFLYIARLLAGTTGGGTYVTIPIFVAEIADSQIRGTLGSLFCFSMNIGMLLGFIIASHISYLIIPCIVMMLPILYLVLTVQLPETPQYLLRKGQTDEAENSLKYYKNFKGKTKEDQLEFDTYFNEMKISILSTKSKAKLSLDDVCAKSSMKAIITGIILVMVNGFSGVFTILNYSSVIFTETHSSMDPNTNTIIIGAVQVVGSFCAFVLVDRHGRKFLLLMSTACMCIGLTTIGVYSYMPTNVGLTSVGWLPVILMSLVIFSANIGVVAVTFVVLVEILPPKIRSFGTTVCLVVLSLVIALVLKVFPLLMATFGLSSVMWMFACVCAFGFVFVLICLKETKGMSLDDESAYN